MNRRRLILLALSFGCAAGSVALALPAASAGPTPGSQGTDTSLPLTDSAVIDVPGRGRFSDLKITVNQTRNLTDQAISITWTGGDPTLEGPGRFAGNYLQIFQCWGDDDGEFPENPGPPPEQCVQGAAAGEPSASPSGLPNGVSAYRVVSRESWENFDPEYGVLDERSKNVWLPFRAVDGTEIPIQIDSSFREGVDGSFWLNPYFGIATTNEIAAAPTRSDGTGAELMQVLTGVQSSGLGCGQTVQHLPGDATKIPRCWVVVVPRGTPAEENVGTPFEVNPGSTGVYTSPLAADPWQNRIAIEIEFNPVDSACELGSDERRLSGTELAVSAVASWQPALCGAKQLPPFSYGVVGDGLARQQITSGATGAAGMAVLSRPVAAELSPDANPVVYAPLTLSGLVIGFNMERFPDPNGSAAAQALAGVRVAELNLSPRLVAKLLTQSYTNQVRILSTPDYEWIEFNPPHLGVDPDFRQFNPEFELMGPGSPKNFGGLALPAGNSDAARQVWDWILADPEAKSWLDGEPDPWGMVVNPVYSTSQARNPSGFAFGDPVPESFPKADPYCYDAPPRGIANSVIPPKLCGTDWMPYARGFADAAVMTRRAYDAARTVENPFALVASDVWKRDLPQSIGQRSFLSLTDTASAAQYGLQTARLSRAGDDRPNREFIAAADAQLLAGVQAMEPAAVDEVLEPRPAAGVDNAYPLTTLTYAAIRPLGLSADARSDYAAFIDYASSEGQQPGLEPGRLPRGYVPLPRSLVDQALAAADTVRNLQPPAETPTPSPSVPGSSSESVALPPGAVPANPSPGGSSGTSSSGEAEQDEDEVVSAPTPEVSEPNNEPDADSVSDNATVTPSTKTGRTRYAIAGLGAMSALSLLGALEVTKHPRRAHGRYPADGQLDVAGD